MTAYKKQLSELFDGMVTMEYMDDYIGDIEYRVSTGRITPEDMKIVEKYKEYKQQHEFKRADLKKLMNILVG